MATPSIWQRDALAEHLPRYGLYDNPRHHVYNTAEKVSIEEQNDSADARRLDGPHRNLPNHVYNAAEEAAQIHGDTIDPMVICDRGEGAPVNP